MIFVKRTLFFLVIVLVLTAPLQYYNDSIQELPSYVGLIAGLIAVIIGVIYERKHPESLYSATFWDVPRHSLKALIFK